MIIIKSTKIQTMSEKVILFTAAKDNQRIVTWKITKIISKTLVKLI